MRLPFAKEKRSQVQSGGLDYTDVVLQKFQESAQVRYAGEDLAAVRFCSNLISNCFALAEGGMTAWLKAYVARELVLRGEALLMDFVPVANWDVQGEGVDAHTWNYRLTITAPSGTRTVYRRGDDTGELLHFRMNVDRDRPWKGQPPWRADATLETAIAVENAVCEAAKMPSMHLLDTGQFNASTIKSDVTRNLESTIGRRKKFFLFGAQRVGSDRAQVETLRPVIDPGLVELRMRTAYELAELCGVPAVLLDHRAEGTSRREGFRQLTLQTLEPMAAIIGEEYRQKTMQEMTFDFSALHSADLQGRARSVAALVKAGLSIDEALAKAGLS